METRLRHPWVPVIIPTGLHPRPGTVRKETPLMSHRPRRAALAALALVALTAVPAVAADPTPDNVGIQRANLGLVQPATAPGLELGLWEVILPGWSAAPPHTHAGYQIIYVVQGVEGYHIHKGTVELHRKDGSVETYGPGDTFTFTEGEWLVESPGMEHEAWNETGDVLINLAASLFPANVPLSISVDFPSVAPTPPASPAP